MNQLGHVIAVDERFVWLDVARQSPCQTCQAKAGCGKRLLDSTNSKAHIVKVALPDFGVSVGDQLELELNDEDVAAASLLLYGLPLVTMLVGGGIGHYLFGTELSAIFGSVLGFAMGAFSMRFVDQFYGQRLAGQLALKTPLKRVESFSLDTI